MTDHISVTRK